MSTRRLKEVRKFSWSKYPWVEYLTTPWYVTTVRVECVTWWQGRYLTTLWCVTTVRAKCVVWCEGRYLTTLVYLTTPWYMTTVRAECAMWCQERYLTTLWYVTIVRAECDACYHTTILLVIKDTFGELMMLLVTENSRVFEKFSGWWKYSL